MQLHKLSSLPNLQPLYFLNITHKWEVLTQDTEDINNSLNNNHNQSCTNLDINKYKLFTFTQVVGTKVQYFTTDWLYMVKSTKTAKVRHGKFLTKEFGVEKEKKDPLKATHQEFKQTREKLEDVLSNFNLDEEDDGEMKTIKPGQVPQHLKIKKNDKKMTKKQKKTQKLKKIRAEKYGENLQRKVMKNIKKDIQKIK